MRAAVKIRMRAMGGSSLRAPQGARGGVRHAGRSGRDGARGPAARDRLRDAGWVGGVLMGVMAGS